uniref:Uncharacterized protein n=1 Tax=Nelumbo nucifera TaxID=4432 RepID=A0A822YXY5_NELNU|nr:TPA_asm: hypothetical protein HUJ06_013256 [Nelumbo nucifera]
MAAHDWRVILPFIRYQELTCQHVIFIGLLSSIKDTKCLT